MKKNDKEINIKSNLKYLLTADKFITFQLPKKQKQKVKNKTETTSPEISGNYSFFGKTNSNFFQKKKATNHEDKLIKLPKIMIDIDSCETDPEGVLDRSKELKDVLKLSVWEKNLYNKLDKANQLKIQRKRGLWENHSVNDVFMENGAVHIEKFNLQNNTQLKEFYKKNSEEQTTIFLQNVNVSLKKFKFDVFQKQENNSKKINFIENRFENLNDEKLQKELKRIGIDLFGNLDHLSNVDLYRNIIRRKMKIEAKFRQEIIEVSNHIFEIKFENKRLLNINGEYSKEINELKEEILDETIRYESEIKERDNQLKNNIQKNEDNKTKGKITKEENEYKRDLTLQKMLLNQEFEEKINIYNEDIQKLVQTYNENKILIKENERVLNNYKNDMVQMNKIQSQYYLDLLSKGIDVRNEGLSWIVKKLIELNVQIDYNMFPKFLDNVHIDFIIKISNLQLEENQLKSILKILKSKQKKRKEEDAKEGMRATKNTFTSTTQSKFTPKETMSNFNQSKFSQDTVQTFEKIFEKYDFMVKKNYEQQIEEIQINELIEELKEKIRIYRFDETIFDSYSDNNNEFISQKNNQQYFQEIIMMRTKIKEIQQDIYNYKNDEMKFYKRKFEVLKNGKFNIKYDLIYSAMFGNNIVI